MNSDRIKALVDRFLAWPLPASVCSDTCVANHDYKFPRSGTNLLTADEARQMIEYLFADPALSARVGGDMEALLIIAKQLEDAADNISPSRGTHPAPFMRGQAAKLRAIQNLSALFPPSPVEVSALSAKVGEGDVPLDSIGRVPEREAFWLVERNVSPPQYISRRGAPWDSDVWIARRFTTEREAHDYWRNMGATDRQQFKVVEHLFINKIDKAIEAHQ